MILRYDQGMNTHHEAPDHPLTETDAAELYLAASGKKRAEFKLPYGWDTILRGFRAAYDLGRATNPVDDRPWEPLNGRPVHVGYEVRQDRPGMTITAVVGRVDEVGDPWATGGNFIGRLDFGTWYFRRTDQELPTVPDTVIERADGHKYITATVDGETYRAREAMLSGERWHAVWRRDSSRGAISFVRSHEITPGTWKVADL